MEWVEILGDLLIVLFRGLPFLLEKYYLRCENRETDEFYKQLLARAVTVSAR